jgi:hypothetical protein
MPKIQSETIEIVLSKLVRNSDSTDSNNLISPEILATLESVVQELVGEGIVVEVTPK